MLFPLLIFIFNINFLPSQKLLNIRHVVLHVYIGKGIVIYIGWTLSGVAKAVHLREVSALI